MGAQLRITRTNVAVTCTATAAMAAVGNRAAVIAEASAAAFPENYSIAINETIPSLLADPLSFGNSAVALEQTLLFALIPWLCWFWALTRKGNYRPGEEHGSARLMTAAEIAPYGDAADPENNIILSRRARMKLVPKGFSLKTDRNKNVLILGGPGSGKTRYIVKPNLMQLNSSVVITDPKGTLIDEVGDMYREAGYAIKVLNTIDFSKSMHYNPLAYIRSSKDIPQLTECIVRNAKPADAGKSQDPFWDNCEKLLINSLIAYMYEAFPKEERTFRNLVALMGCIEVRENDENHQSPLDVIMGAWETGRRPEPPKPRSVYAQAAAQGPRMSDVQEGFVRVGEAHPNSYAVLLYKQFKVGAGKTLKSVMMTANSDLWQFTLEELLELTDYDEMGLDGLGGLNAADLAEASRRDPGMLAPGMGVPCGRNAAAPDGQRKTALFVVMNDSDRTFSFLIATLMYQVFNIAKQYADEKCGGKLPVPVQFWLDEFANIGKIADFDQLITTLRSRNMAVSIVLQSLNQLDTNYGKEEANVIKAACDSWVFLGGGSDDTFETLSKMLGNETVNNRNSSKSFGPQHSSSESEQILQRAVMMPDEVRRLSHDRCIVIINGENGYEDEKYRLEEAPRYELIDPGHRDRRGEIAKARERAREASRRHDPQTAREQRQNAARLRGYRNFKAAKYDAAFDLAGYMESERRRRTSQEEMASRAGAEVVRLTPEELDRAREGTADAVERMIAELTRPRAAEEVDGWMTENA